MARPATGRRCASRTIRSGALEEATQHCHRGAVRRGISRAGSTTAAARASSATARRQWRQAPLLSALLQPPPGWSGYGALGNLCSAADRRNPPGRGARSLRPDRMSEERPAIVIDDPYGEQIALHRDLAKVVDATAGEERARVQSLVEGTRPAWRRRQRAGDELVEREARRGVMADQFGVVHVGGDEYDVLHGTIAERAHDEVALEGEARRIVFGHAEDARIGPGIVGGRRARRHRKRHARDDDLPGGRRRRHALDQPAPLRAAQHRLARPIGIAVRAAVLPRVQDEHIEESAPLEPTVETSGLLGGPSNWPV